MRRIARLTAAWLSLLLTGPLVTGCAPVDLLNATISTGGLRITHDISFETGALAANPRLRLDLYRPDALPPRAPVVVFIYGGSWQDGRRGDYLFVAAELARRGVIVVVPDYRVYPEVRYPDFVRDGAAAVAFALARAESWGGGKVFVMGHSAGAYIALMLALDPSYLTDAGASRDQLAGVVGISGPYDFRPIVRPDIRAVFGPAADTDAAQPITHVDGHAPKLLLLTGTADTTVEPRNTAALAARVRAAGGLVATQEYPGVGHIGTVTAFAPLLRDHTPVLDDVMRFIGARGSSIPPA